MDATYYTLIDRLQARFTDLKARYDAEAAEAEEAAEAATAEKLPKQHGRPRKIRPRMASYGRLGWAT